MYLKKIEIHGFKSFQQKTEVKFHTGLTGIVGPNGCGKTNIVDALRWSLGEQKSSTLRSDKMENVIFNGTANRKPMGMAEVSLFIENDKKILPTEYSEVTISRRIFRSGESEYLLNKNLCRLKDITNLFMDTGMGANAYSVIELKMIETILSNKTEERRILFEEAAGVNKYKLRRRLTLKKLDEVKSILERVNDIVSEVEKKVNLLERQAKKADKYNNLSTSLRELELDLAERELASFIKNKEVFKEEKEISFSKKLSLESEIQKNESIISEIRDRLFKLENQLKLKRAEVTHQTEKIFSAQKTISVSNERKNSLEQNIKRFTSELEELKIQLKTTEENIVTNNEVVKSLAENIEQKENDKILTALQVTERKQLLEEKRSELKIYSESLIDKFKEISIKENELSNLVASLARTNNQIKKLNEKIETLSGNIAKFVSFIEELTQDKIDVEKKIAESENLYSEKLKEKESLEFKVSKLKEQELQEKGLLNSIKDKIYFLQNLIDNLEGFSKGAKALLDNNSWTSEDKNLLANLGDAEEKYRFAIEASLKNNLNNILVSSLEDVKRAIKLLEEKDYGKASFYIYGFQKVKSLTILEKIESFFKKRNAKQLQNEKEFLAWADSLITTDVKWKNYFDELLSDTAIVNTLDDAFLLSNKYKNFNFTTLNGDYVHKSGVIEGGSSLKLDDTLFGRKQLLENLKKEIPQKEKKLSELRSQIENLEVHISEIDLKGLSERGRVLFNDLANVEKQLSQFEYEKTKTMDELDRVRQETQDLARQAHMYDDGKGRLQVEVQMQIEEKKKFDSQKELLESEVSLIEKRFNETVAEQNKLNLEFERLNGERKNLANALLRWEEDIKQISRSIAKREEDIFSSSSESELLKTSLEQMQNELEILVEQKKTFQSEEEKIDQEYRAVRNQIGELGRTQADLRKQREDVGEVIHSLEIKLNEIGINLENLKQNIQENYFLSIELKQFDDLENFNFKTRKEEVHQLKQQIKNLGPINSLAYSEYEEEKQRSEFLNKQRNDLIESERDLVKTINEINSTAEALFRETFEKIRENFITIFRSLFNPGDEADLRLEENVDPLEAKIEIIAKPKGKRPTSIELLSGGEKTLTAIALLFAIYLVKPSPFCILDEIDAPLDDANIDRFTKILKEFSKNTQFVVVTHNKRTMEACDSLYGVTMEEEGVSKLVSVRFNEELGSVA